MAGDRASAAVVPEGAVVVVAGSLGRELQEPAGEPVLAPRQVVASLTEKIGLPADAVEELVEEHAELWRLEDLFREATASDALVAAAKRRIDRANRRRHMLIDALDAGRGPRPPAPGGRLYGQTVGELVDGLIVLQAKVDALSALAAETALPAVRREECGRRLALCLRKAGHLAALASQLAADFAAGRASLPPRADPKLYDDEELRRLSRAREPRGRLAHGRAAPRGSRGGSAL